MKKNLILFLSVFSLAACTQDPLPVVEGKAPTLLEIAATDYQTFTEITDIYNRPKLVETKSGESQDLGDGKYLVPIKVETLGYENVRVIKTYILYADRKIYLSSNEVVTASSKDKIPPPIIE